ncbi:MAG TPA: putative toxin-antitoxin system toxin component, PIN family, partial [Candidatus Lambdaproteobacteria bacterium]|nr:putative toxin-antitoxin system toxin component, PIN family [Candidatus Lambdaproteobacteria bacterium]
MKNTDIILDTNVLFSGLYSSSGASYQILRAIEKGQIKIVTSTTLIFEYEDILRRKKADLKLTDAEIEIILDNLCYLSRFQKIYFLWRPFLKDPKDDHVLEVAIASQTKTIVTQNIKDFTGSEYFGIRAIS